MIPEINTNATKAMREIILIFSLEEDINVTLKKDEKMSDNYGIDH